MIWFSFFKLFPTLRPFIKWCAETWIGTYIHTGTWAFKFIETVHILAWVVLLGTTMIVNFRLLGILQGWSVELMARTLGFHIHASMLLVALTGALMFLSDPFKYYSNDAFGPKMVFFAMAAVYQLTLYRRVVHSTHRGIPAWARVSGGLSLLLWFAVGAMGRAIAI
jgi:hypothetical protein